MGRVKSLPLIFYINYMAFTLSYSVTERNDNKLLTITDTSGEVATGTATGWGAPNDYTGIDGATHTLEFNLTITTSNGEATTYDTIDLFSEFGPFATVADLVFELDPTMLKVGTVSQFTSDSEFPDGIYEIEYVYDDTLGTEEYTTSTELVYGIVRNIVYELSRTIPMMYECGAPHEKSTLDIIFMNMYLSSTVRSSLSGREASVLNDLYSLERLVTNTSNYTW